jgi:CheY-like chemotaxis protein
MQPRGNKSLHYGKIIHKIVPLKKPAMSTGSSGSKLILFGEDDLDDKEFLVEVFSAIDGSFYLEFVNNGQKVLSTLENIADDMLPCLIVLDYNMPELNGAEILRELKLNKRYDSIPKIIWSTSGSDTYKSICLALGAQAYVMKPSNVKDLEDTIRFMISLC